jgi:hypothetical protein
MTNPARAPGYNKKSEQEIKKNCRYVLQRNNWARNKGRGIVKRSKTESSSVVGVDTCV